MAGFSAPTGDEKNVHPFRPFDNRDARGAAAHELGDAPPLTRTAHPEIEGERRSFSFEPDTGVEPEPHHEIPNGRVPTGAARFDSPPSHSRSVPPLALLWPGDGFTSTSMGRVR